MRDAPAADPLAAGTRHTLRIERLGAGGAGVAGAGVDQVLVPATLPGELITAEIVRRRGHRAWARTLSIREPSPRRVPAPCPHFAACGGCHLQHLRYEDQLEHKRDLLCRHLVRALGNDAASLVEAVVPAPAPLGYRTRNLFRVETNGVPGAARIGFVDPRTHEVLPIRSCLLAAPGTDAALAAVRDWLLANDGSWLRYLLVRIGANGARAIVLVAASERVAVDGPDDRQLPSLVAALAPAAVHLNLGSPARHGVLGERYVHLGGPPLLRERVGPVTLELAPATFAQVNPDVAALLYARAMAELAPGPGDDVLDLYCGSGGLALHLARAARRAYGVDTAHLGLRCAERSRVASGVAAERVTWRAGRAEVVLKRLWARGTRFSLATANPPRRGLHRDVVPLLCRIGVRRVVYVSCSPATLARDVTRFVANGFRLVRVVPFDQFAQTRHLEALALLSRDG